MGLAFPAQPGITVYDAFGNIATSFIGSVSIAITTGTAGATLGGTTTVNAVNGVGTFNDLSIDKVGTNYTLTARSTGLTNAVSQTFTISPPAIPMHLRTDVAAITTAKGKQYITTLAVTNHTGVAIPAGTVLTYSITGLRFNPAKPGGVALTGGTTVTGATAPKGKIPGSISATLDSSLADGASLTITLTITARGGSKTSLKAALATFSSNTITGVKTDGSFQRVKPKLTPGSASAAYAVFANTEPLTISVQPAVAGAPTGGTADSTGLYDLALAGLTKKTAYTVTIVGAWSGVTATTTFKAI